MQELQYRDTKNKNNTETEPKPKLRATSFLLPQTSKLLYSGYLCHILIGIKVTYFLQPM